MNAYLFLGVLYFLLKKILFSLQERANEKRTRRPKLLNHVSTRDIKVVSYNMLALPLARDPPIADRLDHIERELMHQEPDSAYQGQPHLICMQEVDSDSVEEVKTRLLNRGYSFQEAINVNKRHGLLSAWLHTRFRKLASRTVDLDTVNREVRLETNDSAVFLRGCLAYMLVLEDQEVEQTICVINCHLFHDPKYEFVKYGQMAYLGGEITKLREEYGTEAVIWCGDFNSMPYSNNLRYAYRLPRMMIPFSQLKAVQIQKPKIIEEIHRVYGKSLPFVVRSAYDEYYETSEEIGMENVGTFSRSIKVSHPTFTNWTRGFKDTLDYIFYTPAHFLVEELGRLIEARELISKKIDKLPNSRLRQASDHVAIRAILRWREA